MPVRYEVRGRVPDILLPRVTDAPPVPVRGRPREAVALIFPDERPGWDAYLHGLADHSDAFADWDGRAIAVAPSADDRWRRLARELGDGLWMVQDENGRLRAVPSAPAAAAVDRYGEIYHVWDRDRGPSGAPGPRELEEWLRFLALQCPE
jgi:hypothetical protein